MEPQVLAAIITGSIALIVAVVGVVATGVAQARATKRAHENALALFQRQSEEQANARAEAAAERRRLAHLDDRKHAYIRLLTALDDREDAQRDCDEIDAKHEATDPENVPEMTKVLDERAVAINHMLELTRTVIEAAMTVQLVAPNHVAGAAFAWMESSDQNTEARHANRTRFLRLAREDLSADG